MRRERHHPLARLIIGVVIGAVVGFLTAPVAGMLITGDSSTMGGREQGFVGFLYGVYWGPVVGALIGVTLTWFVGRRKRQ